MDKHLRYYIAKNLSQIDKDIDNLICNVKKTIQQGWNIQCYVLELQNKKNEIKQLVYDLLNNNQ